MEYLFILPKMVKLNLIPFFHLLEIIFFMYDFTQFHIYILLFIYHNII